MNYLTCPHCGETYRNITAVHVCSSGPYAVKLPADTNINTKERIRELAQQAGFIASAPTLSPTLEKFAELIVQECAGIADEPTSQPFNSYSEKIKKHFGVE